MGHFYKRGISQWDYEAAKAPPDLSLDAQRTMMAYRSGALIPYSPFADNVVFGVRPAGIVQYQSLLHHLRYTKTEDYSAAEKCLTPEDYTTHYFHNKSGAEFIYQVSALINWWAREKVAA